jgi:hypothetical protein
LCDVALFGVKGSRLLFLPLAPQKEERADETLPLPTSARQNIHTKRRRQ